MPDTNGYMVLGFIVVFSVLGVYIGSLALRLKNAGKDVALIRNLMQE